MSSLLKVTDLCKSFKQPYGLFSSREKVAFGPVSFTLEKGETLAVVGESGSGKSALVRTIAGVLKASSGDIYINGESICTLSSHKRCVAVRMIFQDPSSSLNPKMTVGKILNAPIELNTNLDAKQRYQRILDTLKLVGLLPDYLAFYPEMLSGMQKHQVAIARAMILNPDIILVDEILTTLDISLRFKIVNLLLKIQQAKGLSYIFVAHNMHLVKHMSDQIMVLHQGKIVEKGPAEEVCERPQHEQTKYLLLTHQPDYRK
ncbi:peptide ABC transporter ATP-binding protein [Psychromonas sp. B3M02]|uniref:ATP-binding cassette domain-containing protein n=1 Tax=unclassified Psychromonas TaxID=2614957 RepID=UPI000DE81F92|nr:ATP-binding cassette domain-containing protein [Psychromonas sp. B3M02]RBW45049.1 peptide ABC transporter ATP-binding protein [Psychromonas sp. B3M02]